MQLGSDKERKPAPAYSFCDCRSLTRAGQTQRLLVRQVIAHMMPDLPNVGWERDVESFREFFENPAFRTDGLKVYPTLVIRGTGLYELWMKGLYKNYAPDKARCSQACIRSSIVHCARQWLLWHQGAADAS